MKNVITIDGPSGSGKGTISKLLARKLGYSYLDTGALYRAVAWKAREEKIRTDDEEALERLLDDIRISFEGERIFVDGSDVSAEIRTAEIGELSSQVSAKPVVRTGLFSIQREMGLTGNVVIEGRDTGTAIFPEAEHKFYLDAGIEERARRRYEELKNRTQNTEHRTQNNDKELKNRAQNTEHRTQTDSKQLTIETVMEDLVKRDTRDASRESSPLMKTDDMIYIDSTSLSIDEVVATIMEHLK
ncbi:MAG: (d)CMP kinase [Nitrospiraceae bacterium]|nr:MAG: (d)CMP kinase [Nitrospiraceae bacterium]